MSRVRFILMVSLFILIMILAFDCNENVANQQADDNAANKQADGDAINQQAGDNAINQQADINNISKAPEDDNIANNILKESEVEYRFVGSEGKFGPGFFKRTVEELESDSVAVLKVTMLYSEDPDYEKLATMPIGEVEPEELAVTLTTVTVDEVYKTDRDLKIGDELVILEPYQTYPHSSDESVIIISSNGILPMKQNQQYLLFLKRQPPDAEVKFGEDYYISGSWQGKYSLTTETINANKFTVQDTEILEFWEYRVDDTLLSLTNDVFEKYVWNN